MISSIFIDLLIFISTTFCDTFITCSRSLEIVCCTFASLFFKRAMKSYFMHYSCVAIVLFNTALYRSAFPMVSFRKLPFLFFFAFFE